MKVAVVSNTQDADVLVRRGRKARESYNDETISWIIDALEKAGHEAAHVEGDARLIDRLGDFLNPERHPRWPGLVLNLAYGVQGRLRYVHVPGLLEMLGIPYVGSGPLAHALCSDKITTKIICRHCGLPTPDFAVLTHLDFTAPEIGYPLVVKPRAETTSMGIEKVENEEELREVVREDLRRFRQPVLAERYVEGREINVSVLGNNPPRALPLLEIRIDDANPGIYSEDDKLHDSGREIELICPASLEQELAEHAVELALRACRVLGCEDWARADFRLDDDGNVQLLEVNSMPHVNPESSFVASARQAGMESDQLLDEVIAVASERWRGGKE